MIQDCDYSKLPRIEYSSPEHEVECFLWANMLRFKNETPVEIEYVARNALSGIDKKVIFEVVIALYRDIQTWTTEATREYPTTEKIQQLEKYAGRTHMETQWRELGLHLLEGKDWAA